MWPTSSSETGKKQPFQFSLMLYNDEKAKHRSRRRLADQLGQEESAVPWAWSSYLAEDVKWSISVVNPQANQVLWKRRCPQEYREPCSRPRDHPWAPEQENSIVHIGHQGITTDWKTHLEKETTPTLSISGISDTSTPRHPDGPLSTLLCFPHCAFLWTLISLKSRLRTFLGLQHLISRHIIYTGCPKKIANRMLPPYGFNIWFPSLPICRAFPMLGWELELTDLLRLQYRKSVQNSKDPFNVPFPRSLRCWRGILTTISSS